MKEHIPKYLTLGPREKNGSRRCWCRERGFDNKQKGGERKWMLREKKEGDLRKEVAQMEGDDVRERERERESEEWGKRGSKGILRKEKE